MLMATDHTVNIKFANGTFVYTDENGKNASTLDVGYGETVQWICDDQGFDIYFFDGPTKKATPFGQGTIAGTTGHTLAQTVTAKDLDKAYPYSVRMRDTGQKDDPQIRVQNPTSPP
jgi:hypothetical protein